MNKTSFLIAAALVALCSSSFAQDTLPDPGNDAARQQRMNDAYRDHAAHPGAAERAEDATKRDAHEAGHAVHHAATATGHGIRNATRATGHAIHNGVRATGHAIHHGVDKLTGKQ